MIDSAPHSILTDIKGGNMLFAKHSVILLVILLLNSCGKSFEKINPDELFTEVESSLDQYYIFYNNSNKNKILANAYSSALKSISPNFQNSGKQELIAALNLYNDTEKRVNTYKALSAFLSSLPKGINTFIPPESLFWSKDPKRDSGIGLIIRQEAPGRFIAIDALEGSASHREKIKMGKYITAVDDRSVSDMDIEELVGRIKGPLDSVVKLSFNDRSYKLVRSRVSFQNILNSSWNFPGGKKIEYIVLRSAIEGSSGQIESLIENLSDTDAIVLDIRKMQLGNFSESFKIADLFISSGRMGSLKTKNHPDQIYNADQKVIFKKNIYLIVGKYQSPFADAITIALQPAENITVIGSDIKTRDSFISKIVSTESGVELRITTGYILDPDNLPVYEKVIKADHKVSAILPVNPPLSEPDPEDAAQMKIVKLLK